MDLEFLHKLLDTPSVSGFEEPSSKCFCTFASALGLSTRTDGFKNSFATLGSGDIQILVESHIDEIGFQVIYISEEGYLYIRKNGGIDESCLPGEIMSIITRERIIPGVIGKKPIHLQDKEERAKTIHLEDIWVDTGLSSEEVHRLIKIGDPVVLSNNIVHLGDHRIASKGLDDKIGIFILFEVMKALAKKDIKKSICFMASSQEEVGNRGARSGSKLFALSYSISIDVTFATDVPDCSKRKYGDIELGKGVVISRNLDSDSMLSDLAESVTKSKGIPYQLSAQISASGGTDAAFIKENNPDCKIVSLGIPTRYMHTPVEVCDMRDVEAAIQLIVEIIQVL